MNIVGQVRSPAECPKREDGVTLGDEWISRETVDFVFSPTSFLSSRSRHHEIRDIIVALVFIQPFCHHG